MKIKLDNSAATLAAVNGGASESDPTAEAIAEVWSDVDAGLHDTFDGNRPFDVFIDRDGDISVAYRAVVAGGIPWEAKVALL